MGDEQAFGDGQFRNGQRWHARMRHDDEEDDEGFKNVDDEVRDVIGKIRLSRPAKIRPTAARSRGYKAILSLRTLRAFKITAISINS